MAEMPKRCQRIIVTAYTGLLRVGASDVNAFASCVEIFRIHHPKSTPDQACLRVAEWIDDYAATDP